MHRISVRFIRIDYTLLQASKYACYSQKGTVKPRCSGRRCPGDDRNILFCHSQVRIFLHPLLDFLIVLPAIVAMLNHIQVSDSLEEAIFQLDDDYREPLVLQVLMGHSTKEIAELMGMQQGAILTRLHRARIKLKDEVEKEAAA